MDGAEFLVLHISTVQPSLLKEVQDNWVKDPKLVELIRQLQSAPTTATKYRWSQSMLRRHGKLVVKNDEAWRHRIIELFHCSTFGGHSGVGATYKRVAALFYWKRLEKQTRQVLRECDVCQRCKYDASASLGLLQPLPNPSVVWEEVNMDFIEGLPKSSGYEVIFVVVDCLSKYAYIIAPRHPYIVAILAWVHIDNVYKLQGIPKAIVSDRDTMFLSVFWGEFFRL